MRLFASLVAAAIVVGCSPGQPDTSGSATPPVSAVASTPLASQLPSRTDFEPLGSPGPLPADRLPSTGWIAFSSEVNGVSRVGRVAPNGTDATDLVRGSHPEWSPDGATLAFSCVTDPSTEPETLGTCSSRADGSARTTLIKDGYAAQFSPDGGRIAYLRGVFDVPDVFVTDAQAGGDGQPVGRSASVLWAPGSDRLLLHVEAGTLAIVGMDGRTLQTFDGYEGAWSPDGRTVAYFRIAGSGAILQFADSASGTLTAPGFAPESAPESIVWLDRDRLLFLLGGDIWRLDLARRTEPVRLTVGLEIDWPTLSSSPDLRWVAFTKTAGQDAGLYVASADGGWALIVPAIQLRNPDWQPAP